MKVSTIEAILPDSIDIILGKNLRFMRMSCSISQQNLGKAIGVSFQQIQKYEKGENKISGARLFAVAKYLDVPIKDFFHSLGLAASKNDIPKDVDKTALELIYLFNSLHSQQTKTALINLIKKQIDNQKTQALTTRSPDD
ncbi:MAG: helix-turn-helix transcriptional regulator [Bdellovibrionales bacterium]